MKRYDLYDKDASVKSELVAELRTQVTIGRGHPHIVQYEQVRRLRTKHPHTYTYSIDCL